MQIDVELSNPFDQWKVSTMNLVVDPNSKLESLIELDENQSFILGRASESDICINDPSVSRRHCQILSEETTATIFDLDSRGGTYVNGVQIKYLKLKPNDLIRIGNTSLLFEATQLQSTDLSKADRDSSRSRTFRVSDLIGSQIHSYEIKSEIGSGASGVVYLAWDRDAKKEVAFKVLWPEISQSPAEMQRFVRAMKTIYPVRHPNIIQTFNAGKWKKGIYWHTMELFDGKSLFDRLGEKQTDRLPWQKVTHMGISLSAALVEMRKYGVVHRNISPTNIMMSSDQKTFKVTDAILAKALESCSALSKAITAKQDILGNVAYVAPELTVDASQLSPRTDLYSLGATMYYAATGRAPFSGQNFTDLVERVRHAEVTRPRDIHPEIHPFLELVILRAMSKSSDERYREPIHLLNSLIDLSIDP